MNVEFALYLIDVIKNINDVLVIFSVTCAVLLMGSTFWVAVCAFDVNYEKNKEVSLKCFKTLFFITLIISTINLVTPSEKTMYLIMGDHYLKKSPIPSKVELALEKKIDGYIERSK